MNFELLKVIAGFFIIEYYQIPLFLEIGDDVSIIDDDVTGE